MTSISADGIVEFRFFRPHAQHVFIVGDFNGWRHDEWPMHNDGGTWLLRVRLSPGTYRFRYVSDGCWFTDYASFGVRKNSFGSEDSVLVVPTYHPDCPFLKRSSIL